MRDDRPLQIPLPSALPGVILRQARRARMHGLVPAMPSLIRVTAGVKEVLADGAPLSVASGQFVLLPEGMPLTICNIPDAAGHYIAQALPLPRAAIEAALTRLPHLTRPRQKAPVLVPHLPPEAAALFAAMFAPSTFEMLPPDMLALKMEELALWLALSGAVLAPAGPARLSDRLRALIAADPAAGWSAPHAARQLAVSEATLRRRLAAEGGSFGLILRDVRLTHALALLQTTSFPIVRVAEEAGYASPQQFAVRFRARFGLAPHEIRLPEPRLDRNGAETAQAGAEMARVQR